MLYASLFGDSAVTFFSISGPNRETGNTLNGETSREKSLPYPRLDAIFLPSEVEASLRLEDVLRELRGEARQTDVRRRKLVPPIDFDKPSRRVNSMPNRSHVGITALDAERTKLLSDYRVAVEQAGDDPVKTEPGNIGEAALRAFLKQFLPRKYGVTKGHIITPDLDYAGPLEEWDIIIYDRLEAPVLFVRRTKDEGPDSGKRGIPVEYVKVVIEVKSTLNSRSAEKAAEKLTKLNAFIRSPEGERDRTRLPYSFRSSVVFFTTDAKNCEEFVRALGALAPIWQQPNWASFMGGLIVQGHTHPKCSAQIAYAITASKNLVHYRPGCEWSASFSAYRSDPTAPEMPCHVLCTGFGESEFWDYMIELVHHLNGHASDSGPVPTKLVGGYGTIGKFKPRMRLFDPPSK